MRGLSGSNAPDPRSVIQGMTLLAYGRPEGIRMFGSTVDSLLAALSPGLAMCLVGLFTSFLQKDPFLALGRVELSFCTLLALPVISHFFARRWGKEGLWLRYATAAVWCEWVSVFVSIAALAVGSVLFSALAGTPSFGRVIVGVSNLYGLWLGIFVAKTGLQLSWFRATLIYGATACFALCSYEIASLLSLHYNYLSDLFQPVFGPGA